MPEDFPTDVPVFDQATAEARTAAEDLADFYRIAVWCTGELAGTVSIGKFVLRNPLDRGGLARVLVAAIKMLVGPLTPLSQAAVDCVRAARPFGHAYVVEQQSGSVVQELADRTLITVLSVTDSSGRTTWPLTPLGRKMHKALNERGQ